jgi:hypothetical protein
VSIRIFSFLAGVGLGRRESGDVMMLDFVDDAPGRLDPFAVVVDLRAGLDGFEDGGTGGRDGLGVLDDVSGGEFEIQHAAIEEASGVGVAVDDARTVEIVATGDVFAAMPVKEVEFDVFAVLVSANFAFTGMAFQGGCVVLSLYGCHLVPLREG